MADLVSVLIPCFNAESRVALAIESALRQTYRKLEVVVLDDGSTDGSLREIQRFASLGNFRFETGPNRGGSAARNRLIELASGEYIQFLDADDELLPPKVARCLMALTSDADVAWCDYLRVEGSTQQVISCRLPESSDGILPHLIVNNIQTSSPLHRRDHLRAIGGFDTSLRCCQEYDLHIRLAQHRWRTVVHVDEPLFRVNRIAGSVSSNYIKVAIQAVDLLERMAMDLERSGQWSTALRRSIALAAEGHGRSLARRGRRREARGALDLARRVSFHDRVRVSACNRALSMLLGPIAAESVLGKLRLLIPSRH